MPAREEGTNDSNPRGIKNCELKVLYRYHKGVSGKTLKDHEA
jgi:hypothetical protein